MGPLLAPTGTGTVMLVLLHDDGVASVPLKPTVLDPCVSPKLAPVIVTVLPTVVVKGSLSVMTGITRNDAVLLPVLFTVTTTFVNPTAKLAGTRATTRVSLQDVVVAVTPPNVT